jgi:hypothetical protein
VHNVLFLIAVSAFGLICFFDGPHLGKDTDRSAFRDSDITNKFVDALEAAGLNSEEYAMLGDKIFVNRPPNFLSLPLQWQEFDNIDSVCRTSVEWSNCKITQNWKGITYSMQMKVQLSPVAQDIVIAALLTNCHTLLRGCQTHLYFQDADNNPLLLEMPTLSSYFNWNL